MSVSWMVTKLHNFDTLKGPFSHNSNHLQYITMSEIQSNPFIHFLKIFSSGTCIYILYLVLQELIASEELIFVLYFSQI